MLKSRKRDEQQQQQTITNKQLKTLSVLKNKT